MSNPVNKKYLYFYENRYWFYPNNKQKKHQN